jgi:hypothetical protein
VNVISVGGVGKLEIVVTLVEGIFHGQLPFFFVFREITIDFSGLFVPGLTLSTSTAALRCEGGGNNLEEWGIRGSLRPPFSPRLPMKFSRAFRSHGRGDTVKPDRF